MKNENLKEGDEDSGVGIVAVEGAEEGAAAVDVVLGEWGLH